MKFVLIQFGNFFYGIQFPIHLNTNITLLLPIQKFFFIFALSVTHHGGQNHELTALDISTHSIRHLTDRLGFYR